MSTQLKKLSIFNSNTESQIAQVTQLPFDIKTPSHTTNASKISFGTHNDGYTEGCSITLKPSSEAISVNDILQPPKGMKLDFTGKQLADSYHSTLNEFIKVRKADYNAATKVEPVKEAFEAQAATLAKNLIIAQLATNNSSDDTQNIDISSIEQAAIVLLTPAIAHILFPNEDMTYAKMWVTKELAQGTFDVAKWSLKWGFEQVRDYLKPTDTESDYSIDYTDHNPMDKLNTLLDIAREQSGAKWKIVEIETLKTIEAFKALESVTIEFDDARETLNTFVQQNFIPAEKAYYEHIQHLKALAELTQETDEIQLSDVIHIEDRLLNLSENQSKSADSAEADATLHSSSPELLAPHQPAVELGVVHESLDFSM